MLLLWCEYFEVSVFYFKIRHVIFFVFHQDMHVAATWNQAQAASFLSALEVEQQLR